MEPYQQLTSIVRHPIDNNQWIGISFLCNHGLRKLFRRQLKTIKRIKKVTSDMLLLETFYELKPRIISRINGVISRINELSFQCALY